MTPTQSPPELDELELDELELVAAAPVRPPLLEEPAELVDVLAAAELEVLDELAVIVIADEVPAETVAAVDEALACPELDAGALDEVAELPEVVAAPALVDVDEADAFPDEAPLEEWVGPEYVQADASRIVPRNTIERMGAP